MMDRRKMLETMLGGLVAATTAVALAPTSAEAMPLTMGIGGAEHSVASATPLEKAAVVVRTVRRPVRRRVCFWRRGRRVCYWR